MRKFDNPSLIMFETVKALVIKLDVHTGVRLIGPEQRRQHRFHCNIIQQMNLSKSEAIMWSPPILLNSSNSWYPQSDSMGDPCHG